MCVYFLKSESERPDIYLRKYWHESERGEHVFYNFGMKMKNKFITEMHTRNLAPADLKNLFLFPRYSRLKLELLFDQISLCKIWTLFMGYNYLQRLPVLILNAELGLEIHWSRAKKKPLEISRFTSNLKFRSEVIGHSKKFQDGRHELD